MLSKSFEPWTHREPRVSTLFHTLIDRVRVRGYWGPLHLVKNMQTLGQFFEPLYIYPSFADLRVDFQILSALPTPPSPEDVILYPSTTIIIGKYRYYLPVVTGEWFLSSFYLTWSYPMFRYLTRECHSVPADHYRHRRVLILPPCCHLWVVLPSFYFMWSYPTFRYLSKQSVPCTAKPQSLPATHRLVW